MNGYEVKISLHLLPTSAKSRYLRIRGVVYSVVTQLGPLSGDVDTSVATVSR